MDVSNHPKSFRAFSRRFIRSEFQQFTRSFTHRRRGQPRRATPSSSREGKVKRLAQGHLDTQQPEIELATFWLHVNPLHFPSSVDPEGNVPSDWSSSAVTHRSQTAEVQSGWRGRPRSPRPGEGCASPHSLSALRYSAAGWWYTGGPGCCSPCTQRLPGPGTPAPRRRSATPGQGYAPPSR